MLTAGEHHIDLKTIEKELPNGIRVAHVVVGDEEDEQATHVFMSDLPANTEIATPHTHACDYLEIVLEGSIRVGKTWYKANEARVVKAHTGYGPLVTGPDGCKQIIIFSNANWVPIPLGSAAEHGLYPELVTEMFGGKPVAPVKS
jgi:hypothetical protein